MSDHSKAVTLTSVVGIPPARMSELSTEERAKLYGVNPEIAEKIDSLDKQTRSNILSDLPVREDALGFAPLVKTLCDIALSRTTETPIAIAINGKWGSGKTSILRMLEAQARLVGFNCIWLNAWSLESSDNLLASVAAEIQREIRNKSNVKSDVTRRLLDFIAQAGSIFVGTGGGVAAKLVELLVGATGGTVEKIARSKHASQSIDADIREVASVVSTRLSFEHLVRALLDTEQDPDARLIVFLDDIDRALPDQVATILKNLKLVLEVPRCVFILGMDIDIVAKSIENYYLRRSATTSGSGRENDDGYADESNFQGGFTRLSSEKFGHNYLEKLVQLTVSVPSLTRESLESYLDKIFIAKEVSEIVRWAPDQEVLNPRRLKKYINWLSLTLQLLNANRLSAGLSSVDALRSLALKRDYPEIYSRRRYDTEFDSADLNTILRQRILFEDNKASYQGLRDYFERLDSRLIHAVDLELGGNAIFTESLRGPPPSLR